MHSLRNLGSISPLQHIFTGTGHAARAQAASGYRVGYHVARVRTGTGPPNPVLTTHLEQLVF